MEFLIICLMIVLKGIAGLIGICTIIGAFAVIATLSCRISFIRHRIDE